MALKDWKKTREDEWEKKDKSQLLMLYTGYAYHKLYWVRIFYINKSIGISNPKDITKPLQYNIALKKAKQYMKKH